jgi:hypothetical protein
MDRTTDSDEMSARSAVAGAVEEGRPSRSRQVRTNVPEQLPIMPGESDLILQHLGDLLANIFDCSAVK